MCILFYTLKKLQKYAKYMFDLTMYFELFKLQLHRLKYVNFTVFSFNFIVMLLSKCSLKRSLVGY